MDFATRVVQGSQVAVLPDGTLAICWYDSTDDGVDTGLATVMVRNVDRWRSATFARSDAAGYYREVPVSAAGRRDFRYGALPAMAAGRTARSISCSGTAGRAIRTTTATSICFARSMAAQTWEEPIQVNQDGTNASQFFPQITFSRMASCSHVGRPARRSGAAQLPHLLHAIDRSGRDVRVHPAGSELHGSGHAGDRLSRRTQ